MKQLGSWITLQTGIPDPFEGLVAPMEETTYGVLEVIGSLMFLAGTFGFLWAGYRVFVDGEGKSAIWVLFLFFIGMGIVGAIITF